MSDKRARYLAGHGMMRENHTKAQLTLRDQVKHPVLLPNYILQKKKSSSNGELFPAPCAQDYKHHGHSSRQQGLPDVVRSWPTPTARDYKDGSKSSCANVPVNGLLGRAIHTGSVMEGQLNADWVEALMGYPLHWTDVEKDCSHENRYPQAWLDGAWEDGLPRVITGQKNRPRRIKALGNSIVPQIPCLIFLSNDFDKWR